MNSLSPIHTARTNLCSCTLTHQCLLFINPTVRLLGLNRTERHTRLCRQTCKPHSGITHPRDPILEALGHENWINSRLSSGAARQDKCQCHTASSAPHSTSESATKTWAPLRRALYSSPGRWHGSDFQKFWECKLIDIQFSRRWSGTALQQCLMTVISAGCRGVN